MNISDNCAVKIAVRERPARRNCENNLETNNSVINYHPNGNNIIVDEKVFTFDCVAGPTVTQLQIFDRLIKPMVDNLKMGYNCTALAYGQTGTGKSYTMGLNSNDFESEDVGVIPRCLKEIFAKEEEENLEKKEITASFIEIYNEKVYDLLADNPNEPILAKGYKYTGATCKPLTSLGECYAILTQGNKNRHVRPTKMNSQSSRSHAIFTIHLKTTTEKENKEEGNEESCVVLSSCMNIVDLAGSEGVRRTGHQGMAMSEGVNINQGLLSIGKVLQAMTMGSKVIPYRDSVLTTVLQDSLNSKSYMTLLACVSPHREDLSETLSTLRFAQNAKQLKNTPEINTLIADLRKKAKMTKTPYKIKPLQVNNVKATPMKRPYTNVFTNLQAKSAIKSNTFCTPKKQRMEVNKCNQTDIARPKLSHVNMDLPKMAQWESTHNRESMFNRSLDSNGSLLSLNMSTSTAVDGPACNKNSNFGSPVIRKCLAEMNKDFANNFMKMFQQNFSALLPQTPAAAAVPATPVAAQNQTQLPTTIRQEIKNIIKEVMSEANTSHKDANKSISPLKTNVKRPLFNSSSELFKIPEIPEHTHRPITSSPLNNNDGDSSSFTQTFFEGATTSDKTVLNKSIRRSRRISFQTSVVHDQSLMDETTANQSLRRSSRKSVLHRYQEKRKSIRLACHTEVAEPSEPSEDLLKQATKKSRKSIKGKKLNNTIIDGYCNNSLSSSSNAKTTTLSKHRKAILELLNKGSMKDLQILPQVGQKTAYLIVTQRTLNGRFKSLNQVEKLPIWRGNGWERFAQANMLK